MTGYILFLLYLVLFLYIFKRWSFFRNIPGLDYKWIVVFFMLKVFSGIVLSIIYKHYYDPETADIYKYFYDGIYLYNILWENPIDYLRILSGIGITGEHVEAYLSNMSYWFRPWESPLYNDNRVVIRFNALVGIFSFGHIHIHTLFANLLSFTGLVALYKFFVQYIQPRKINWLKWGVFLFPSLLLWSSGILKEAVLIGSLGVFIFLADALVKNRKYLHYNNIILVISLWILILLKPYVLILLLPCFAGFYITKDMIFAKKQLTYFILYTLLLIPVIFLHLFLPEYDPVRLIARKQNDLINLAQSLDAGSLLHSNYLKPEFFDIIKNIPNAFMTTLFRPHIFEADNILMLFAGLENLLVILMIVIASIWSGNITKQPRGTWFSLWFFIAGFSFIGLTAPVAGAIVRYKIVMLPFLWYFVLNLFDANRSVTSASKS